VNLPISQFLLLIVLRYIVTESPLDPWVSVDASGVPVATITPVLTTVDGVATTISAVPASLTATSTTANSDKKPTDAPPPTGGGSYQVCHNHDAKFAPFCRPNNGTDVYVGEKYYGMEALFKIQVEMLIEYSHLGHDLLR